MINITMNFASVEQMQAAFAALAAHTSAPAVAATPEAVQAQAAAAIDKAAKTEAPKAPKPGKAEKPAATPAASETAIAAPQAPAPAEPATESPSEPKPVAITLEAVRAKLTALSQAGKAAEVKELIAQTGAAKLTEVPADKYATLLEKAEAL